EQSRESVETFLERYGEFVGCVRDVASLSEAHTKELIAAQLGSEAVDARLADEVFRRTSGNPFAITEVIRGFIVSGILYPTWKDWLEDWDRLAKLDLPINLIDLVKHRVAKLSGESRRFLVVAALVG